LIFQQVLETADICDGMAHHTKDKGDLAVSKVIADLIEKDYAVFTSFSEHQPFDLIAYRDGKCFRIQVKYRENGHCTGSTVWNDKHGTHVKEYGENDFDYYALYLPQIGQCVYPSIKFRGATIRCELPTSATPFYWWEDFKDLTNKTKKKTFSDFGFSITKSKNKNGKFTFRILSPPPKTELKLALWNRPIKVLAKEYGVSDKMIKSWAKKFRLNWPPKGHWKNGSKVKKVW